MSSPLLMGIASGVLSGGFLGAGVSVYTARLKTKPERDSIIVTGAETAVVAIEKTLSAETRRADRAEAALARKDDLLASKDARIAALEQRLDLLQQHLDETRSELHAILQSHD